MTLGTRIGRTFKECLAHRISDSLICTVLRIRPLITIRMKLSQILQRSQSQGRQLEVSPYKHLHRSIWAKRPKHSSKMLSKSTARCPGRLNLREMGQYLELERSLISNALSRCFLNSTLAHPNRKLVSRAENPTDRSSHSC